MCSQVTCAGKQIIFAVCFTMLILVSGECPANCYCSRYKTICSLARLNSLPTQLPSTTELLSIEADNIPEINGTLISNSGLQNLLHLELVNVQLLEIQPEAFKNMSQLEYLIISHNNVTFLKQNTFIHLQHLYFLDLSHNGISEMESGTFAGLHNLRHLDIGYNYIKPLKADIFEGMGYINNCSIINIRVINYILLANGIEPEILKYLCTFTQFKVGPTGLIHIPSHIYFGINIQTRLSIPITAPDFVSDLFYLPGLIFNNINHEVSGLLYLDISKGCIENLTSGFFQNLNHLLFLDLSQNEMSSILSGGFEGLTAVKILNLSHNKFEYLKNGSFRGLESLETLKIKDSRVRTIEGDTFRGLYKLKVLDLSLNHLQHLETNTFAWLQNLKELKLENNIFHHIDSNAFPDLMHLKCFSNAVMLSDFRTDLINFKGNVFYIQVPLPKFFGRIITSDLQLFNVDSNTLLNLDRLDSFGIIASISLPESIQVLKTIHLYIDTRSIKSRQDFRDTLVTLHYIGELKLTLIGVNSIENLNAFTDPQVSQLSLLFSDLKFLDNRSSRLIGFPMLKYLTIQGNNMYSIHKEAFLHMLSLEGLNLQFGLNVTFEQGSFYGLQNLKQLTISSNSRNLSVTNLPMKCLDVGLFVGLDNLKRLELMHNFYSCLRPGAFHGLHEIEEINLNDNDIRTITTGVFGAVCDQEFEMSCTNVTRSQHCNNTNALTTLKYLNLGWNNISHIQPLAFASCINLRIINLAKNDFLTLDIPFLYTPGLRYLYMDSCNITEIPNNTFVCTPLLSVIDFNSNTNIKKLTVDTLLPLRNLKSISIKYTNLLCDCELYETWHWMRNNRVRYEFQGFVSDNTSLCGVRGIEQVLSVINCNVSTGISIQKHISNSTINDFAFFKKYVEPIVLIIIFISGLTCNGFLLFIALRHSDMRTMQNACIIHLVIVDVLSLIVNLPFSYWDVINIRWEFEDTACKIFLFSKDMLVSATVFTIISLSVERFLVARTFKDLKKVCISKILPTTWLLVMTWISAIVLSLPAYYSATVDIRCLYCPSGNQDYIRNVWTFQLIIYCLLPGIALTFFNVKTSIFLRESIRRIPGEIKYNVRAKNRKRVANIVLILILIFAISYLPNYILRTLVAWSVVNIENVFLISFFTYCLFFLNTVLNPISIFIMSTKFKSYALNYFPVLEK